MRRPRDRGPGARGAIGSEPESELVEAATNPVEEPAGSEPLETFDTLSGAEVKQRATSGVLSFAFRGIAVKAMGFVSTIVLARFLVPAELGTVAVGSAILVFGIVLSSGGFGAGLIQRPEEPTETQLRAVQGFQLVLTCAFAAVVVGVGLQLGEIGQIAALMCLSLPLSSLRAPLVIVAQRRLRYGELAKADVAETAFYQVLLILLVVLGFGIWGIAAATVVRPIVGTAVLMRELHAGLVMPGLNIRSIRSLLGFGAAYQAQDILNAARDYGINLTIAAIAGAAVLGFWNLLWRLLQVVLLIYSALYKVSFSAMARLIESGEAVQPVLRQAYGLTAVAIGFFSVALCGTGPALTESVFGHQWAPAIDALPWVTAGMLISGPVSTAAVGYLLATGQMQTLMRNVVLHTIAWFAVMVPLLPSLGVQAVGIGVVASASVDVLLLGSAVKRATGVGAARIVTPIVLIAAAGAAVGWAVAEAIGPTLVSTAVSAIVAELVYVSGLLAFRRAALLNLVRVVFKTMMQRPAFARLHGAFAR